MKIIELTPRLALAASFVRQGARFADIGTDHAKLPIFLLQSGKIETAIAADIAQGPILRAKNALQQYEFSSQVKCILTPGFAGLETDSFDDAAICGMGGLTIIEILSAVHPFLIHQHLILQPMTDIDLVRRWLFEHGYELLLEQAVREGGRFYSVLLVAWTDKKAEVDEQKVYTGKLNPMLRQDDYLFLKKQEKLFSARLQGALSTNQTEQAAFYKQVVNFISNACQMGEEV